MAKSSNGLNSAVLSGSDSISWLQPKYFGDITSLSEFSALGQSYSTVSFDSVLIRSVITANKKVSWRHPNKYTSLFSVVSSKTSIRDGILLGGSPENLDYIDNCLPGLNPPSRYYGFYVDDYYYANQLNILGKTLSGWAGALIGWGNTSNYSSQYNTVGGFGFTQYYGQYVDFSRHYHGFGNACTASGWNGSEGNAVFKAHALLVR